jgi:Transposase IS66 family
VRLRHAAAKPILDDLETWLQAQLPRISGRSELAKAIRYALARMRKLRPYLDHGSLEADDNPAERAMKPIALGRKNSLFVGSAGGGKSAAIAYTLIVSVVSQPARCPSDDGYVYVAASLDIWRARYCAQVVRQGDAIPHLPSSLLAFTDQLPGTEEHTCI